MRLCYFKKTWRIVFVVLTMLAIADGANAQITSPTTATGTYGQPFSYQMTFATTPSGFAAEYGPSGFTFLDNTNYPLPTFNIATGLISGTPNQVGTFLVTLSAGVVNLTTLTRVFEYKTLTITIQPATATVSLNNLAQPYSGSPKSVVVATSPSGLSNSITYAGSTTPPTNAGSYAVVATIASTNYAGTASGTLVIAKADQTISFASVGRVPPGGMAGLTASASSGLGASFSVISGNASVSGSTVSFNDTNPVVLRATQAGNGNYNSAFADQTVTPGKLDQSLTFSPVGTITKGTPTTLSATASSALSVSFSLVSGNATLSGSTLTLNDLNPVVVRATQAGDSSYNTTSVDQTITASVFAQTIAFNALITKKNTDAPFALTASSTSNLPITFTLVSGPATISGNTVTLNGAPGTVVVRASQAGNNSYLAASDVTQSFSVQAIAPLVYFGTIGADGKGGDFAIYYSADTRKGTLVGFAYNSAEGFVVDFTLDANSQFVVTSSTLAAATPEPIAKLADSSPTASTLTAQAVAAPRTFRGQIDGAVFTGSIDGLGLALNATLVSPVGSTASLAGLYRASALDAASGSTSVIVAATGQTFALTTSPDLVSGALGTISSAGAFTVQASPTTMVSGSVNPANSSVSGSVQRTGGSTTSFAGVSSTVVAIQRIVNLSLRGSSSQGADILISGFVITGTTPKPVLLRAVGPGLTPFGVAGALPNPRLRLFRGSDMIAENDDWGAIVSISELTGATTRTGAFPLTSGSKDAALYVTLDPGSYTMQVFDPAGSGVALTEVYDASPTAGTDPQRLINLSARGRVGTGDALLIGGFVVTGNSPKRLLVRGVGGGLTAFGVAGALPNPLLRIYRGQNVAVENDDWDSTAAGTQQVTDASTRAGAFPLTAGSKDAAVVTTLVPGAYTVILSGVGTASGVALLEIYELPD